MKRMQFFTVFMLGVLWGWLYAHFQVAWWAIEEAFGDIRLKWHFIWTWRLLNTWAPWVVAFWFAIVASAYVVWQLRKVKKGGGEVCLVGLIKRRH